MFGGRFRLGSALTLALSICLVLVRMFLVRAYYDRHPLGPQASLLAAQPSNPQAPPASSWLIFATTDHESQVRTQHARLRADDPAEPGAPSPASSADFIELRSVSRGAGEIVMSLGSVPAAKCTAIDHVAASFDSGPANVLEAESEVVDAGCTVKIAGFDRFVQGLLNAQTLVMTPQMAGGVLRDVSFHVAGLTWE